MILGVGICMSACKTVGNTDDNDSQKGPAEYIVCVNDSEGKALSGIGVSVYAENDKDSLVWFALTGEDGKISFTEESSVNYVAVLANVPEEYEMQASYKMVDTCAAEYNATTPYFYSTYEQENESIVTDKTVYRLDEQLRNCILLRSTSA